MTSYCWIRNENIRNELKSFFRSVDQELSRYYESHPTTSEPILDGHLASRLEPRDSQRLELHLQRIAEERRREGLNPLTLTFNVNHITSEERTHGADIGLVIRISLPQEYELTKAALVQSKRLYPNNRQFLESSIYSEIFSSQTRHRRNNYNRLVPQWERLLEQTPASVYFLYGPERFRSKNGKLRDLGTRVIPTQIIQGISNQPLPSFSAGDAYRNGKSLSEWLVDDFICCSVGDTRPDVITKALGNSPDFPVWSTIQINLDSEVANPNLWSR